MQAFLKIIVGEYRKKLLAFTQNTCLKALSGSYLVECLASSTPNCDKSEVLLEILCVLNFVNCDSGIQFPADCDNSEKSLVNRA